MRWLPLALVIAAGCTNAKLATTTTTVTGDAGGPPPPPPCCCTMDATLACSGDSFGVTCPRGATPEGSFGVGQPLSCSDPLPGAETDGYCCIESYGGGRCWSDLLVAGCEYPSLGFSCSGSDPATDIDPGLSCKGGAPDPASGTTPYCCQTTGGTCAPDQSVAGCDIPSVGFSCAGTATPVDADPSLTCSAGAVDQTTGDTLFCCQ